MIGFYFRESDERSVAALKNLKEKLDEKGLKYRDFTADNADKADVDLMIVFGGDGSVLRAAKYCSDKIPIVAINTGKVGFLTSYECGELDDLVDAIVKNTLVFTKKRLMKIDVGDKVFYALNDFAVLKNFSANEASGCVKLHFEINEQFVATFVADGIVVATPTGSTAYALSAGGPIITPDVEAFVLAPVCAHSLHARPIVFSSSARCSVKVDDKTDECALYVDGVRASIVPAGGKIYAELADIGVSICEYKQDFFARLSEKLNIWSTTDRTQEKKQ